MPKVVLLAEDSREDAESVQLALKGAGVANSIRVVADGEEAIAYLKGEGRFVDREKFPLPRVLFLDLKMPRAGGFEVLEWVRAQPSFKDLLIVVLTAYGGLNEIKRAYALGANSFLFKPGNPAEIKNLIKSFPEYWISEIPIAKGQKQKERQLTPAVDEADSSVRSNLHTQPGWN